MPCHKLKELQSNFEPGSGLVLPQLRGFRIYMQAKVKCRNVKKKKKKGVNGQIAKSSCQILNYHRIRATLAIFHQRKPNRTPKNLNIIKLCPKF